MNKPKVLIVQERVMHYRMATYRKMQESVDLTLAYLKVTDVPSSVNLPILKIDTLKIGHFRLMKNAEKLFNQYDVVIILPHLKFLNLIIKPFTKHKYKIITWSIGIRASYRINYDITSPPSFTNRIVGQIIKRSDAAIFYMPQPIEYWVKYNNLDSSKCFVAHNTVPIVQTDRMPEYKERNSILFVGTLYKQKGLEDLIISYGKAKSKNPKLPNLVIVGDGPEKQEILNLIDQYNISENVILTGGIYDENILKDYFLNAKLCISPRQAGLTVLKSLGYGVPFITMSNAITGGERLNVISGYNGILYDKSEDLTKILLESINNPEKFESMSNNALDYYRNNATVENMAQGAIDAIYYALNIKK